MIDRPLALLAAACLFANCGNEARAPLAAAHVWVSAARPGTSMSAAYLELSNPGALPQTVTAVTSPQYARVEMHATVVEGGIARMRGLPELVVAPGTTLRFEPGAMHLMLLQRQAGDERVTLQFWSRDSLLLTVEADSGDDGG